MQALQRIENRIDALLQTLQPSAQSEAQVERIKRGLDSRLSQYWGWLRDSLYYEGVRFYHKDECGSFDKEITVDYDMGYKISNIYNLRWRAVINEANEPLFWDRVDRLLEDRGGDLRGSSPSWEDEKKLKEIEGTLPHVFNGYGGWKLYTGEKYKDGVRYCHTNRSNFLDIDIIVDKDLEYKIISDFGATQRGNIGKSSNDEKLFWERVKAMRDK
jgi:hypothetical protein